MNMKMEKFNEQVKELRDKADTFEKSGCAVDGIVKAFRDAADAIDFLSAKTGGWIPCRERLPEENGKYLCTTVYGEMMTCDYDWNVPHSQRKFFHASCVVNVVAWMPLPESYKMKERKE